MSNDNEDVYWRDPVPSGTRAQGGYFFRAYGLADFITRVEADGHKVLGIRITSNSNEIEILTAPEDGDVIH